VVGTPGNNQTATEAGIDGGGKCCKVRRAAGGTKVAFLPANEPEHV